MRSFRIRIQNKVILPRYTAQMHTLPSFFLKYFTAGIIVQYKLMKFYLQNQINQLSGNYAVQLLDFNRGKASGTIFQYCVFFRVKEPFPPPPTPIFTVPGLTILVWRLFRLLLQI